MLGLAYFLFYWQAKLPLSATEVLLCCVLVTLAGGLGILPYVMDYRAVVKHGALLRLIELSSLGAATEKIQNLESCAIQITGATEQLQAAQGQADKTVALAGEISQRMALEVKEFTEFMQQASDGEKAMLRLETDKLRRAEGEWLNVTVYILDHIFALNRAAARSGQENLIRQLAQFQAACRDAARRVGLVPVLPGVGEVFDPEKHQLPDGEPGGAGEIEEVLTCGYSYQGRLIRRTIVKLNAPAEPTNAPVTESCQDVDQDQLPFQDKPESAQV